MVQEVEFGRVYKWCPEYVVIECDCGERLSLTGSTTVCKWERTTRPSSGRGVCRPVLGRRGPSPLALRRGSRRRRVTLLKREFSQADGVTMGVVAVGKGTRTRNVAGRETVAYGDVRVADPNEPTRAATRSEENRRYSWLEDYLERLDGKEARWKYYAGLEQTVSS